MDHDSLSRMKIFELPTLCREDKGLYKGFSKFKKKYELITFIVSKNTLPEIEEFQESSDDIGEAHESMFQEPLSSFGLSNGLFRARPTRKELDEKVLEVTKKTKLLNIVALLHLKPMMMKKTELCIDCLSTSITNVIRIWVKR